MQSAACQLRSLVVQGNWHYDMWLCANWVRQWLIIYNTIRNAIKTAGCYRYQKYFHLCIRLFIWNAKYWAVYDFLVFGRRILNEKIIELIIEFLFRIEIVGIVSFWFAVRSFILFHRIIISKNRLAHIIWSILHDSYHMAHVIWAI